MSPTPLGPTWERSGDRIPWGRGGATSGSQGRGSWVSGQFVVPSCMVQLLSLRGSGTSVFFGLVVLTTLDLFPCLLSLFTTCYETEVQFFRVYRRGTGRIHLTVGGSRTGRRGLVSRT